MCDGEYQQTENNDKKLETYPESVLNFAECIKTATENTSPKESDESRSSMETKNELNPRQGNDSEKSSVLGFRSSTSVGSSCSPVSYSHHSCGSLFVKCAEHGRWPLLQTFTNRESPLSQKTFTNRPYHPRNRNSDETDRRPKKNDSEKNHVYQTVVRPYVSKQSQKTNLRTPDTSLPGILSRGNGRKSKNRVKFANSFSELKEEKVNKKEELVSRPSQQMIVRRHNSLPDRRILLNGKNLSELNKIFNKTTIRSNQNYHIPPCNEEKGKLELKNKMRKQRSKSVDKINISETNEMEAKGNFEKIAESSRVNDSCGTYCNRIVKNCAFPRSFSEEKKVNFEREHRLNKFKKECHNGAIASDDLKVRFSLRFCKICKIFSFLF